MDSKVFLLVFCIGISGSLALRIIMSPDEADKIMKRESGFSDGLSGFVDSKLKDNSEKQTKKDKVNELKRIITNALQGLQKARKLDEKDPPVSVEIKKDPSPPALPLDVKSNDLSSLEKLVDSLMDEVKEKRKRGCHSGSCMINYGREAASKEGKKSASKISPETADAVDKILQSVKRLVNPQPRKVEEIPSDNIISDSGDVGDRMLAKVKQLMKKKSAGESVNIAKDSEGNGNAKAVLEAKVEKLLQKISQLSKKEASSNVGDVTLNAVKDMVAKRKSKVIAKDEKIKGHDEISLKDIKKEINQLLSKISPNSGDNVKKTANEVVKEEIAVENEAVPAGKKTVDKRRQMIVDLLKSYDEMTQKKSAKSSDVYASQLEKASRTLRSGNNDVSSQTKAAIRGFNIEDGSNKKRSHPK